MFDGNSIQHQIESGEDNDYYYIADDYDDDADNSNYIYIVNTILSGTARLNVLLPTATILAFTIFAPLITDDGKCTTFDRWLMGFFVALSATSCVFFSFTDSFRTATGRLYYGVATFHGIRTFNGGRVKPCVPSDYRLRWADIFHAALSLTAFLTFAMLHNDVLSCYHLMLPRKVIYSVPLAIGFIISVLFVLFPSRRRGIGYPFLLQTDALYSRN
ncbi:protein DMP7-like [Olea europaea var. sylvestris]|uniref:Protein DMP7-like n=1 Tax=Olea europaea subsp. europaea TaxID=158383 RepID=A0A8S0VFX9_OLEEU|nr:protein DMP7-like [Olea europaea var. sylvestris]CAA3031395.1 protein DMP7-like [Olea europaea subsp. europaea]